MSKARTLAAGAAVLCIAASALLWRANTHDVHGVAVNATHGDDRIATGAEAVPRDIAGTPPAGFAMDRSSLRGSDVDGSVSFDANGEVVLDLALRRLFDYHLSLIGERDLPQIRQLLADYLQGRFDPRQTATVLGYFDRYADYLRRLGESKIGEATDPHERLANAMSLRRRMLGDAMATAFFAEEEALAALTLKRMEIAGDATLTAPQKSEQLAELDRSAGYTARADADTASVVAAQDRRFDRAQSSAGERAAEREALWGKEAAQRLAQLDDERARWDARVEQYLYARSRIDADRSLSPAARAQALAMLRAQRFDAAEQRRVASLEAIGQLKPGG